MGEQPRIWADFNNADESGRLRLNVARAAAELSGFSPPLEPGTEITVYDGEIEATGVLEHSAEENMWVASVEWTKPPDVANPS